MQQRASLRIAVAILIASAPLRLAAASDARSDEAVNLGHQALAEFEAGNCPTAIALFERASRLAGSPVFTLYTARCKARLGQFIEAEALYVSIAGLALDASAPSAWHAAQRDAASELDEVRARIARVRITGNDIAILELDGRSVSREQLLRVNPGRHVLEARSTRGEFTTLTLNLAAGQRLVHEVRFAAVQHAEERLPDPPPAVPDSHPSRRSTITEWQWAGYGLLGVSALGLAAGSYFGLRASSLAGEFKPNCNDKQCLASDEDKGTRANRFATFSTLGFAVAGAAAIGGAVILIRAGADEPTTAAAGYVVRASVSGAF
jgi:hypothetical protein